MPKQITATKLVQPNAHDAANPTRSSEAQHLGYLVYWTLIEQDWKADDLRAAARWTDSKGQPAGLPDWMIDRITGRSAKSAWAAATQLGAKGTPSRRTEIDPAGSYARYLTRDLSENARALVREVNDSHQERVSSDTVATLYFTEKSGTMLSQISPAASASESLKNEVLGVIAQMRSNMEKVNGMVDDGRIRALLQSWLEREYRVSVRGTGGVYFIPIPLDSRDKQRVQDELLAIRQWVVSPVLQGSFSIVDIWSGGSTTIDTYVTSAIEEMKTEIEEIAAKLAKWNANQNMNAGSKSFSAQTMVERSDALTEKLQRLTESLGDEMAVVGEMLRIARENALRMQQGSQMEVEAARQSKIAAKTPVPAPDAAEAAPVVGEVAEKASKPARTRKAGTAQERSSKSKIV